MAKSELVFAVAGYSLDEGIDEGDPDVVKFFAICGAADRQAHHLRAVDIAEPSAVPAQAMLRTKISNISDHQITG